jgi:hypothetical protein
VALAWVLGCHIDVDRDTKIELIVDSSCAGDDTHFTLQQSVSLAAVSFLSQLLGTECPTFNLRHSLANWCMQIRAVSGDVPGEHIEDENRQGPLRDSNWSTKGGRRHLGTFFAPLRNCCSV